MLFHLLFKLLFVRVQSSRKNPEQVSFSSFLTRVNFNIPKSDTKQSFIYIRYAWKEIKSILRPGKPQTKKETGTAIHLHNAPKGQEIWTEFISGHINTPVSASINLVGVPYTPGAIEKIYLVSAIGLSILIYPLIKLKGPYKQNLLGLPRLLGNVFRLTRYLKGERRQIYYSGVYEPETNVISYYLQKNGHELNFFVSATPLKQYVHEIFCNNIYLSSPYQQDELVEFKPTVFIDNFFVIGPFSAKDLQYNTGTCANPNVVAVYTSGIWKRSENKTFFDPETEKKEEKVFRFLDQFISEGHHISVKIFLHPIEKKTTEDIENSRARYLKSLKNKSHFVLQDSKIPTTKSFSGADVAVTTISNTIFERLYAGFKTIIVKNEEDWFPLKNSRLFNISSSSYEEFESLLAESLRLSSEEFFSKKELNAYCIAK